MKKINFIFSKELKIIFKALNKDDELRVVGGYVRDHLRNELNPKNKKKITDIDLACKYQPKKTIEILKNHKIKTIPTGLKHGTITALINKKTFEITTLRKDVEHFGRKAKIEFVDNFLEDAKRRDFTINAMSLDANGLLHDYFNGFEDLKAQKVKFIGDAKARIEEDYLRILRFFRFSCYYCNKIDKNALEEIIKLKKHLKELSAHRIRTELLKILQCNNQTQLLKIIKLMAENGILAEIIPTKNKIDLNFLENLLNLEQKQPKIVNPNELLRFCALLYNNKEDNLKITKALEFSNKDQKFIDESLKLSSKIKFNDKNTQIIKKLFDFDKINTKTALIINFSTNFEQNQHDFDDLKEKIELINEIILPKFIINGNDLIKLKLPKTSIGKTLNKLRNLWIESNFKASKTKLLDQIEN